jgi:hypothetical protein
MYHCDIHELKDVVHVTQEAKAKKNIGFHCFSKSFKKDILYKLVMRRTTTLRIWCKINHLNQGFSIKTKGGNL